MNTPPTKKGNPLHISEIRCLVSRFVSVASAISCVRVSKAWSTDFVPPIWMEIDFQVHKTFELLNAKVIAKHGHHIRFVRNLATWEQLISLVHSSINNVRTLHLDLDTNARFRAFCMDLIYNNSKSLETLSLEVHNGDINDINDLDLDGQMISVHAVIPLWSTSKLSNIRLFGIFITRASFTAVLRGCPLLTTVDIQSSYILLSGPSADTFKHIGVVQFIARIEDVFKPDPAHGILPLGSTLLAHFPNLISWTLYTRETPLTVPVERMMAEVKTCCPRVTSIDTWITPRPLLNALLKKVFRNLTSVQFAYKQLSKEVILCLLLHQKTLLNISTYRSNAEDEVERDDLPVEADHFKESGWILQLLPRSCPQLASLQLECHIMDMDEVDYDQWACKGLRYLRVRVQGLDTIEKIDRTLRLWVEGTTDGEDMSIEARVARHLFTFDKLRSVWLGTRTCYAALEYVDY